MGRPKKEELNNETVASTPLPEEAKVSSTKTEDTVQIKKSDYDKLMEQLERNAKDIDLLYKASDKHRMAKAIGQGGEILVHTVKLWTWDDTGKIVIGSSLVSNKCEVVQGKWIEDQSMAVVFEGGETITVPYLEFSRKTLNKIIAEIISTKKQVDNKTNRESVILEVQLPNGKKLEINQAFVN